MSNLATKKPRIILKKNSTRGDEVATIFFGIIALIFVFFSCFRFLPVGKLIDDFVFTLWFGWTKYLVYFCLIIYLLPIFFNYYFKFSFSFFVVILTTFFLISWTIQSIYLMINKHQIWIDYHSLQFVGFKYYWQQWWASTIINNYNGFFSNPLSFKSWNLVTFFPPLFVGGLISNFLLAIFSYGTFTVNLILNLIFLLMFSAIWLKYHPFWFFKVWTNFKKNSTKRLKLTKNNHEDNEMFNFEQPALTTELKQPEMVKNQQMLKDEELMKSINNSNQKKAVKNKIITEQLDPLSAAEQADYLTSTSHLTPFGLLKSKMQEQAAVESDQSQIFSSQKTNEAETVVNNDNQKNETIVPEKNVPDLINQEDNHDLMTQPEIKKAKKHHFTSSGNLTPFGFLKPEAVEKTWETDQTIDLTMADLKQSTDEPVTFTTFDHQFQLNPQTLNTTIGKITTPQFVNDSYQLPSLIAPPVSPDLAKMLSENEQYAATNREKIDRLFHEFKIAGKVINYKIGTTVTKYEIAIVSGMRVNKITGLEDELKLALANHNIRIEAPIPKKSMIGIEVANLNIVPVTLYEQMQNLSKQQRNQPLLISIGKDTAGDYIFHSLTKMPHLLISGSTGSGKSAFINNLLVSLLLQYSPKQMRLLLIDPKWVELISYNDLPHLLRPVISNLELVPQALQKIIVEMMDRYQLLAQSACRNIESYNSKIKDIDKQLPYYVVIIDELADLMMDNSKLIEEKIQRITQMGRAAGIHLIVATQRPSTDVITGVIKNNIPSRIAFKVSSWIDSKTIIDTAGAEKLLGRGDLLFLTPGINGPVRIQAPWIDDDAVFEIVNFIKNQVK